MAAEKYPNGLPKPFSSDPTQWLFNGQPKGKSIAFTLRPGEGAQYRRLSVPHGWNDGKQRKVNAVCWHGHEAVMRDLFLRYGKRGVRIESNMAKGKVVYVSLGDFDASKYDSYEMNVGSQAYPASYGELCECEEAA